MKKSEELRIKAQQEDNDFKSLSIFYQSLREKRSEKFQEWLEPLSLNYNIEQRSNSSYSIETQNYGIIDYFPKANKLLIRNKNKWIKPGLKWIIKELFKE